MDRGQRIRLLQVIRWHGHLTIDFIYLIHRAIKHNPASVDKQQMGQQGFDFLNLVGTDDDAGFIVKVVVEQTFVKCLSKKDIQAQCRFIEHEQIDFDRHDQRQVQLGHHAFAQLFYLTAL